MRIILTLLLTIVFFTFGSTQVFGDLIERSIQSAVLVNVGTESGSGILVQDSSSIYLITARHVLFNGIGDSLRLKDKNCIVRFYAENLVDANQNLIIVNMVDLINTNNVKVHPFVDLCVIKIATFEFPGEKKGAAIVYKKGVNRVGEGVNYSPYFLVEGAYLRKEDLHLGEEVFTVGFPTSLGLKKLPQFDYDRPLLKRCSIAGLSQTFRTYIIDCHVYAGNSGGAVFLERKDFRNYSIKLIGIAVEYVPFFNESASKKEVIIQTSSYAVIVPIQYAIELMKNM